MLSKEQLSKPIVVEMPVGSAICIIAQLQLASRHPGNTGNSAEVAEAFARGLQDALCENYPELTSILNMGWEPEHDVNG